MKFFLVTLLLIDTWGTLLALIVSKLKKETKNVDFMIKALLLDVDGTLLSLRLMRYPSLLLTLLGKLMIGE